jgi:hypothetical protein
VSRLEEQLRDALNQQASTVEPASDLFERVRDSVGDARRGRRRRLVLRVALAAGAVLITAGLWRAMTLTPDRRTSGGGGMSWWTLELATTAALVAIAVWLGPFIKRFGRAYAADVFHDNPLTGKSYIVLTDIVYYLIFTAYILFTIHVEPDPAWDPQGFVTAAQIQSELQRVGGILLIIGLLHGLNIVLMPVLGRLFSLNRRLARPTTTAPSERERIGG